MNGSLSRRNSPQGLPTKSRNPLTGISLFLDDLHDRAMERSGKPAMMRKALEEIDELRKAHLISTLPPPENQVPGREVESCGVGHHYPGAKTL